MPGKMNLNIKAQKWKFSFFFGRKKEEGNSCLYRKVNSIQLVKPTSLVSWNLLIARRNNQNHAPDSSKAKNKKSNIWATVFQYFLCSSMFYQASNGESGVLVKRFFWVAYVITNKSFFLERK